MVHLLLAVAVMGTVLVVFVVRAVRRRMKGRRWQPLREAMLHDATTLPSIYLARIDTRPEPEAGGQVIATDLINGARGPLMLPGANFRPGSVVCFTWTAEGPQIRTWMNRRLWTVCTHQAERDRRRGGLMAARNGDGDLPVEREIRTAADLAVMEAERIVRGNESF